MYSLLVVFQAIDAAGKDGTIRHVMSGVNPQGVEVTSFKTPTAHELDHDFLWRAAVRLPARGMIGIFNRSHYEEVLVVRVHPEFLPGQRLPPSATGKDIWTRRYREINDWSGTSPTTDPDRQAVPQRLARRAEAAVPGPHSRSRHSNWKFSPSDVRERQHWDAYQEAFSEMLSGTRRMAPGK